VLAVVLYNSPRMGTDRRFWHPRVGAVRATDSLAKTVRTLRGPATHYVLNVRIGTPLQRPEALADFSPDDVECREWLGGLLRHYERTAA
jgi:hypothetical protein